MTGPSPPRVHIPGIIYSSSTARLLNLSIAGVALETESRLNVGESYRIGSPMNQDGQVVWCHFRPRGSQPGENAPAFQSGVEFASAVTENAEQILDFIDRIGHTGSSRRVFGRFDISDTEVPVEGEHPCRILDLEDDTLTVEAELLPSLDTAFKISVLGLGSTQSAQDGPKTACRVVAIHPLSSSESVDPVSRMRLELQEPSSETLAKIRQTLASAASSPAGN